MRCSTKLALVLAVVCLVATPALATNPPSASHGDGYYGGRAWWSQLGSHSAGNGGEFTLKHDGPPGLQLDNSAYDSKTRAQDTNSESFQTFCVEKGEFIYPGQAVDIWVSTQNAALTGPGSHAWKGGTGSGDDLDPLTAWLYTEFAKGRLTGYDYTPGSGRQASAAALQNAIWYIEGETSLNSGLATTFHNLAVAADPTGIGDVRILQLESTGGALRQDQLYLATPAPGAAMLVFLGIGLVGWAKRHLA